MKYDIDVIARHYSAKDLKNLERFAYGLQETCAHMLGTQSYHGYCQLPAVSELERTDGTIGKQIAKLQRSMIELEHAVKLAQLEQNLD